MKYIDYKCTTWCRLHLEDTTDLTSIIEELKEGENPLTVSYNSSENIEWEVLNETETWIIPEDNDNHSTVEVYDDGVCIFKNSKL